MIPRRKKLNCERFKPAPCKAEVWKYFDRDMSTNEVRCKICGVIMKLLKVATSGLKFHIESSHGIEIAKVKGDVPEPVIDRGPKFHKKIITVINENGAVDKVAHYVKESRDWLSAFLEDVSSDDDG